MAAVDFTPLYSSIIDAVPGWIVGVLSVTSALVVVVVVATGCRMVLASIRGDVFYGGRYWRRETYDAAVSHLAHRHLAGAVRLDSVSRRHVRNWAKRERDVFGRHWSLRERRKFNLL